MVKQPGNLGTPGPAAERSTRSGDLGRDQRQLGPGRDGFKNGDLMDVYGRECKDNFWNM